MSEKKTKEQRKSAPKELPSFKPFRQVPSWDPKAEFTMTGEEFDVLQEFLNIFIPPVRVVESVFKRAIDAEVVTFKYVDNEGSEVPKEDVQNYMRQVSEYLHSQQSANTSDESPKQEAIVRKLKKSSPENTPSVIEDEVIEHS